MPLKESSAAREFVSELDKNGVDAARLVGKYLVRRFGTGVELRHLRYAIKAIQEGREHLDDALVDIDYHEYPLNFEDWLHSEEHSGRLSKELWDVWAREINHVTKPGSNIVEWYVTGCIGGGKTFASLVATLYKGPYRCACLRWPKEHYGLAEDTPIVFALFNAILTNATYVDFEQIAKFVRGSKWFENKCPAKIKASECRIYWESKDMALQIGSSELHALGANMLSYMIDEANFMKTPKDRETSETQAYKIYHHATRRMKSRFQKEGTIPGLACVVSSRLATSSFLEELMRDNKDNPMCYVTDLSLWEAKGYRSFSKQHFRVAIGNKYRRSEVLDEIDTKGSANCMNWVVKPEKAKTVPEGMQITRVPLDFYFDFNRDIEGSLRDIAGIPTSGIHPLIFRTESVLECVDKTRKHPFLKEDLTLSLSDPDASLVNMTQWRDLCKIERGVWMPLYHSGAPRFIHVDLGLTGDCATFAMGCCYDTFVHSEYDPTTGQVQESWRPKVWVDFMCRIRPIRGEQIDLGKIVAYIVNLKNYGFYLQRVTFDGFASEMAIQSILKANLTPSRAAQIRKRAGDELVKVESYVVSVDKGDAPYRMLRDMLAVNALSYYLYQPFVDEVLELEHTTTITEGGLIKGRVDHPPKGSKDVTDAVCGMVWGIATSRAWPTQTPVKEIIGDAPKSDIETQLQRDVVADYGPDADRVQAVLPPPVPTPQARSIRNRKLPTKNWQSGLDGFNRHGFR